MLSYAINDKTSFDNLTMWRDEFLFYSGIKDSKQFPFLVVGSKVSGIFSLCTCSLLKVQDCLGLHQAKIKILYFTVKPLIHLSIKTRDLSRWYLIVVDGRVAYNGHTATKTNGRCAVLVPPIAELIYSIKEVDFKLTLKYIQT